MKILLDINVFDAALNRLRWIFDEFEYIYVDISGGKDSTVIYNLAMIIAEEKNRLPLNVLFVDQEAEWDAVIDHIRQIYDDPRVSNYWLQIPIRLSNATSQRDKYLWCWKEGDKWIREKEKDSIHENIYGYIGFKGLFGAFLKYYHPNDSAVHLCGMRTEESPGRFLGITGQETYKGETWGKIRDRKIGHYDLYPIYDWTYSDVWKAIHDNKWSYSKIYDYMYQYGMPINKMRVSNLHHAPALDKLFYMQEIEPKNWDRLVARLHGINTAGILNEEAFLKVDQLPYMFSSWIEYRDYLIDHLIDTDEQRDKYRSRFERTLIDYHHGRLKPSTTIEKICRTQINTLFANDFQFTKLDNFEVTHGYKPGRNRYERKTKTN